MLHIVTPLFRYELLDRVYLTIPPYDDVTWHIAKTSRRPGLDNSFLQSDRRIRLYEIDCADADIVAKRNAIFDHIADGYFFLLDDDTICLDEMYRVYQEYDAKNFVGMIVGRNNLSGVVAPSLDPGENRIDTGSVLCHHSVLRKVRWEWSTDYARDRLFWSRCYAYFGEEKTLVLNRVISAYNHFGPLVRVRKTILGFRLERDIHDPLLARCYLAAASAKHHWRRWFNSRRRKAAQPALMPDIRRRAVSGSGTEARTALPRGISPSDPRIR